LKNNVCLKYIKKTIIHVLKKAFVKNVFVKKNVSTAGAVYHESAPRASEIVFHKPWRTHGHYISCGRSGVGSKVGLGYQN